MARVRRAVGRARRACSSTHGLEPGERVAVLLPDGPTRCTWRSSRIEKAGCVIVGIGPRAGEREVEHLLDQDGARVAVLDTRRTSALGMPSARRCARRGSRRRADRRRDDLWLLNSTSGTTGLPKCRDARPARAGSPSTSSRSTRAPSTPDDVFMSVLPAPFGFGIWTAHVTPTLLGAPMRGDAPLRRRRVPRAHRARAGDRARRGVDAVRDAARGAVRAARPRPVEPPRAVHRRRDGAVRAGRRVRGSHRVRGAAVLRVERDRRAVAHDAHDDRERPPAHRRAGHPRACTSGSSTTTAPTSPRRAARASPRARAP